VEPGPGPAHPRGQIVPVLEGLHVEPMTILNTVRIASPCRASWNAMEGDDRARFCGTCRKHVYNLSALTAAEAVALVERTEGRLCGRFYRRRDGSVLTTDCPVGARRFRDGRLRQAATWGVLGLASVLSAAHLVASGAGTRMCGPPSPPSGPGVTFQDWTDWALTALGLRPRGSGTGVVAGGISMLPPPPPPPARGPESTDVPSQQ
jgi:hypothetical protein